MRRVSPSYISGCYDTRPFSPTSTPIVDNFHGMASSAVARPLMGPSRARHDVAHRTIVGCRFWAELDSGYWCLGPWCHSRRASRTLERARGPMGGGATAACAEVPTRIDGCDLLKSGPARCSDATPEPPGAGAFITSALGSSSCEALPVASTSRMSGGVCVQMCRCPYDPYEIPYEMKAAFEMKAALTGSGGSRWDPGESAASCSSPLAS